MKPEERIIEVALAEVLREGPAPDHAAAIRARWEASRTLPRRAAARAWPWIAGVCAAAAVGLWLGHGPAGPSPATTAEPAAPAEAARAPLGRAPVPDALLVEVLPSDGAGFGELVANPGATAATVTLGCRSTLTLAPGAVVALEPTRVRVLAGAVDVGATWAAPVHVADHPEPLRFRAAGHARIRVARPRGPALEPGAPGLRDPGLLAPWRAALRGAPLPGRAWLTVEPGPTTGLQVGALALEPGARFRAALDSGLDSGPDSGMGTLAPVEPALLAAAEEALARCAAHTPLALAQGAGPATPLAAAPLAAVRLARALGTEPAVAAWLARWR